MLPQAIFAATCHATPLATVPDRRNTVLGPRPKGFVNAASTNITADTGNGASSACGVSDPVRLAARHRLPTPRCQLPSNQSGDCLVPSLHAHVWPRHKWEPDKLKKRPMGRTRWSRGAGFGSVESVLQTHPVMRRRIYPAVLSLSLSRCGPPRSCFAHVWLQAAVTVGPDQRVIIT